MKASCCFCCHPMMMMMMMMMMMLLLFVVADIGVVRGPSPSLLLPLLPTCPPFYTALFLSMRIDWLEIHAQTARLSRRWTARSLRWHCVYLDCLVPPCLSQPSQNSSGSHEFAYTLSHREVLSLSRKPIAAEKRHQFHEHRRCIGPMNLVNSLPIGFKP